MLVCPLVFKTSVRGEEPLGWVRFPHIPAMPGGANHRAAGFRVFGGFGPLREEEFMDIDIKELEAFACVV